jgi:hypothetical protein
MKPAVTTTMRETTSTMPVTSSTVPEEPGIVRQLTTWENASVIGGILLVLVLLVGFFVYAAKRIKA